MQIDIKEHPQSEETSTDNLVEEMSETDPSKLSTVGKTRETRSDLDNVYTNCLTLQ